VALSAHKYQWTLRNRAAGSVRPLFSSGAVRATLRELAQQGARMRRIEDALDQVIAPRWRGAVRALAPRDDVVTLRVTDAAAHDALRGELGRLRAQLAKLAPGIRRLELELVGATGA